MAKTTNSKLKKPQAAKEGFSLISNEKLLAIYTAMLKCRMLEQRAATLFQQGRLKSDLHASRGREASAAAVSVDLQPEDTLCIVAGDWLPAFVKGLSLDGVFRALAPAGSPPRGSTTDEPEQKNILVPSVNASLAHAVSERAASALIQKKGAIVVAFIASGSGPLKPWHKTIAAAAAQKLPILFVHYVDRVAKPTKTGSGNPEAMFHGVPIIGVDAFDPVANYRVAYEAIVRARQARGATLIECAAHPTQPPNSASNGHKQPGGETKFVDPVAAMESYLKRKAIEPEPHNRQIAGRFNRELDLATRFLVR